MFRLNRFYDQGAAGAEPAPEPAEPKPEPKGPADPSGNMIPKERFDEVNNKLKEVEGQLSDLVKQNKDRETKELEKREEWKTLAEKRAQEIEATKIENLRLRVAHEKGIPAAMVDRLKGETLEDIQADAEALIPLLVPKEIPSSVPRLKPGEPAGTFDPKGKTPAEIREARQAGKLKF